MGAKTKSSFAGISARNKKEIVPQKPKVASSLPPLPAEKEILDKLAGVAPEETKKEEYRDVEKEESPIESPLPDVEVDASSGDIKKALNSILNQIDMLYFVIIRSRNICSKKFERSCLLECQHYGYCKGRSSIRDAIKDI